MNSVIILSCMELNLGSIMARHGPPLDSALVMQNAGGVASSDTLAELAAGGELRLVIVMQHTGCEILGITDDFQLAQINVASHELDIMQAADVAISVRQTMRVVTSCELFVERPSVRGYVYDQITDSLIEVS